MEKKYIIREVEPEACEFHHVFDFDGLTGEGENYCDNLFILFYDRGRLDGFNTEEWAALQNTVEGISDGFYGVEHPNSVYGDYKSYKEVLEDWGVKYTSRKCHELKNLMERMDTGEPEFMAEYLTITTGKPWAVTNASGYCQGDYVQIVYCTERFEQKDAKYYGEVWLGAAKEFGVHWLDENGEECDSCYGFIVADCQARTDEDYKRIVCEWAGIPEEETVLEMIDGCSVRTVYNYRTA